MRSSPSPGANPIRTAEGADQIVSPNAVMMSSPADPTMTSSPSVPSIRPSRRSSPAPRSTSGCATRTGHARQGEDKDRTHSRCNRSPHVAPPPPSRSIQPRAEGTDTSASKGPPQRVPRMKCGPSRDRVHDGRHQRGVGWSMAVETRQAEALLFAARAPVVAPAPKRSLPARQPVRRSLEAVLGRPRPPMPRSR